MSSAAKLSMQGEHSFQNSGEHLWVQHLLLPLCPGTKLGAARVGRGALERGI